MDTLLHSRSRVGLLFIGKIWDKQTSFDMIRAADRPSYISAIALDKRDHFFGNECMSLCIISISTVANEFNKASLSTPYVLGSLCTPSRSFR